MATLKKITSFTHLITGEGHRIAYTFSEMDENGNLVSQNNKGNYVETHEDAIAAIEVIMSDIQKNHL